MVRGRNLLGNYLSSSEVRKILLQFEKKILNLIWSKFVFKHNIFRLKGLNYTPDEDPQPRKRSNSLPVPKIEVTSHEMIKMDFKEKLPNIEESCGEALLGGSSDR